MADKGSSATVVVLYDDDGVAPFLVVDVSWRKNDPHSPICTLQSASRVGGVVSLGLASAFTGTFETGGGNLAVAAVAVVIATNGEGIVCTVAPGEETSGGLAAGTV